VPLGWGEPVSGRQLPVFRSVRGGFRTPVSARHFSISISAGRRAVRLLTETGSQSAIRVSGDAGAESTASEGSCVQYTMLGELYFFDCGFATSHYVAGANDAGIYRRCYNEDPIDP
jgi:hypothetical protein